MIGGVTPCLAAGNQLGLQGREVVIEEGVRLLDLRLALLLDEVVEVALDLRILQGLVVEYVGGIEVVEVDVDEFGAGTGGGELAVLAVEVDAVLLDLRHIDQLVAHPEHLHSDPHSDGLVEVLVVLHPEADGIPLLLQELVEARQRRGALAHHHVHDEVDEVGGDAEPLDVAAVALLIDLARPHQGDLGEGPGPEIRVRLVLLAIGFGVAVDVGGDHRGDGDEVGLLLRQPGHDGGIVQQLVGHDELHQAILVGIGIIAHRPDGVGQIDVVEEGLGLGELVMVVQTAGRGLAHQLAEHDLGLVIGLAPQGGLRLVAEGLLVGEVEVEQHRAAAAVHGEVDGVAQRPGGQGLAHPALDAEVGVALEVLPAKQLKGPVVVEIELEGAGALAPVEQLLHVTHLSVLMLRLVSYGSVPSGQSRACKSLARGRAFGYCDYCQWRGRVPGLAPGGKNLSLRFIRLVLSCSRHPAPGAIEGPLKIRTQ